MNAATTKETAVDIKDMTIAELAEVMYAAKSAAVIATLAAAIKAKANVPAGLFYVEAPFADDAPGHF